MNSTIVDKISTISEALKPTKNDKEIETITDEVELPNGDKKQRTETTFWNFDVYQIKKEII